MLVEPQDFPLHLFVRLVRLSDVSVSQRFRNRRASALKKIVEMIDNRSFGQSSSQPVRSRKVGFHMCHRGAAFIPKQKLQFAELDRLKPGSRVQSVAKTRKR